MVPKKQILLINSIELKAENEEFCQCLEKQGFFVDFAEDDFQACIKLASKRYDCLVMEPLVRKRKFSEYPKYIRMNTNLKNFGTSLKSLEIGLNILAFIRQGKFAEFGTQPQVPIVIFTGMTGFENREKIGLLVVGNSQIFLKKPESTETVAKHLKKLFRKKGK